MVNLLKRKNILLIILLIIVGLVIYKVTTNHNDNNSSQPSSSQATTVPKVAIKPSGMQYPFGWQEAQQIPASDKNEGVVSEAQRSNPTATAILRIVNAKLDKTFDIKPLPGQTADSLRKGLSGFVLVSSGLIKLGNHDAVQITYKDALNKVQYQSTILIVPTANRTFYFTITAKPADYAKLGNDIKSIKNSATIYIDGHLK